MTNEQIERSYQEIKEQYTQHLQAKGVKMPQLMWRGNYSKKALVLVYLYQGYPDTRAVTKTELTSFLRDHFEVVDDVQQARHLGKQDGWYIDTGTRNRNGQLNYGEYRLISIEQPLPGYLPQRRKGDLTDEVWEAIKSQYGFRCACCGSKEGDPNFYSPTSITELQKGHMDPNKELNANNVIPQCSLCNRPDKNHWVYDKTGRVVAVADPLIVERSSEEVRRAIYDVLKREFEE